MFKLPQLLSHFFQHHQLDTSINFFDFIAMHYGGNDGTTADDDFDSQLPCHNPNHNTIAHVYSPMVKVILPIEFSSWETNEYNSRQAFKTIIPVAKASIDIKTYLFFINVVLTYISSSRNGIAICSEQISIRHACYVTV